MEILKKVRVYDFVKYSSYGLAISIVLIIASFALLAVKGFNLGIDFAGGVCGAATIQGSRTISADSRTFSTR